MAEKCAFNVFVVLISINQVNKLSLIFKPVIKFGVSQRWKKTPSRLKHSRSSLTTSLTSRNWTYGVTLRRTSPGKLRRNATPPPGSRSNLWSMPHPSTVRSLALMLSNQTGTIYRSTVRTLDQSSWATISKGRSPGRRSRQASLVLWRSLKPESCIVWTKQARNAWRSTVSALWTLFTTTAASF